MSEFPCSFIRHPCTESYQVVFFRIVPGLLLTLFIEESFEETTLKCIALAKKLKQSRLSITKAYVKRRIKLSQN